MKFKQYTHFINYIFKIKENQNITITESEYNIIFDFEIVYKKLLKLEEKFIIKIDSPILESIVNMGFKKGLNSIFNFMEIAINKAKKFSVDGDLYYLICYFCNNGIEIEFVEHFIRKENMHFKIFPSRVKTYKVCKKQRSIFDFDYAFSQYSEDFGEKVGIYFIYDNEDELAYIGKSTNCVLSRSFQSAKERNLYDFSKIKYSLTNSKSDVGIYESYYIGKYKPYKNKDMVYDDEVTIQLAELNIDKEIMGIDSLFIEFEYYKEKVIDIGEFFKAEDKIFLYSKKNKMYLENELKIYDTQKSYEDLSSEEYKEIARKKIKEVINKDIINS